MTAPFDGTIGSLSVSLGDYVSPGKALTTLVDNKHLRATGLGDYLLQAGVKDLYIMGLATDYCVKYSCLDALQLNFNVYLIQDACRGVNLKPNDTENALQEMQKAGARLVNVKLEK